MKVTGLCEILTAAIACPSVNPAHTTDKSISGESRYAAWFAEQCRTRGFTTEIQDVLSDRPAVVASMGSGGDAETLIIESHLDTVAVDGMCIPPFDADIRDGRVYGRGACDMKGSTAALLHALDKLQLTETSLKGKRLRLVASPDEECGMGGARALVRAGLRAAQCIVLEPTNCQPVIAHKGCQWFDVEIFGQSGHGSQPQAGLNAASAAAHLLLSAENLSKKIAVYQRDLLLGSSTLNVGVLESGTAPNIIPGSAKLKLDRRLIPDEAPEEFLTELTEILDAFKEQGRISEYSVRRIASSPAFRSSEKAPLVQHLRQAIEKHQDEPAYPQGTSWVSDATPFSTVCDETVVFGPGDIAQAHTADEYIEVSQLRTGAEIFEDFLRMWCAR